DGGRVATRVAFTRDGRHLTALVGEPGFFRTEAISWELATGRSASRPAVKSGLVNEILPDGRSFVTLGDDGVWLHEATGPASPRPSPGPARGVRPSRPAASGWSPPAPRVRSGG